MHTIGSLAKTVTGLVMSASPGKVQIIGIVDIPTDGQKYFILQFVRNRDYTKTYKPFLMKYDPEVT
ncbi:MAG: hypothetical protein JEZ14_21930 [Marinilabiliaceae bacterium]|nr:hypothetical protein [Marinilabiliaceae bacterium]